MADGAILKKGKQKAAMARVRRTMNGDGSSVVREGRETVGHLC